MESSRLKSYIPIFQRVFSQQEKKVAIKLQLTSPMIKAPGRNTNKLIRTKKKKKKYSDNPYFLN